MRNWNDPEKQAIGLVVLEVGGRVGGVGWKGEGVGGWACFLDPKTVQPTPGNWVVPWTRSFPAVASVFGALDKILVLNHRFRLVWQCTQKVRSWFQW